MNRKSVITALSLLAGSAFGVAQAANIPSFDELDTNGDGYLTQEEVSVSEEVTAQFSTVDANQDGQLDQSEYELIASSSSEGATGWEQGS